EIDLVAVDFDAAPGERIGDVLGGNRAVELAALADLHAHRQGRARNAVGGDLGFLSLALALVLAAGDVVLPGAIRTAGRRHGESLRNEEVRGKAVGDRLELAALAQCGHVVGQDDLHAGEPSLLIQDRNRGPIPDSSTARIAAPRASGTRRSAARTGRGVKRRIWATSCSKAARSIPSSSSFSWSTSVGTWSRNSSTARMRTTRSSSPPSTGMSSGMMSRPRTR